MITTEIAHEVVFYAENDFETGITINVDIGYTVNK